jgi:hypothetical protein
MDEVFMLTFVGTLMIGAVAGFVLEQQLGQEMTRWYRLQRMRARVTRRLGEGASQLWKRDD